MRLVRGVVFGRIRGHVDRSFDERVCNMTSQESCCDASPLEGDIGFPWFLTRVDGPSLKRLRDLDLLLDHHGVQEMDWPISSISSHEGVKKDIENPLLGRKEAICLQAVYSVRSGTLGAIGHRWTMAFDRDLIFMGIKPLIRL